MLGFSPISSRPICSEQTGSTILGVGTSSGAAQVLGTGLTTIAGIGSSSGSASSSFIARSLVQAQAVSESVSTVLAEGSSTVSCTGTSLGSATVSGVALSQSGVGTASGTSTVLGAGSSTVIGVGQSDGIASVLGLSRTPRRALIMKLGELIEIEDVDLSTGLHPVIYLDGRLKVQTTSEGVPIVNVSGSKRLLRSDESLLI